jgi:hypothetical protein
MERIDWNLIAMMMLLSWLLLKSMELTLSSRMTHYQSQMTEDLGRQGRIRLETVDWIGGMVLYG